MSENRIPVIIDTDPGVDDAVAIMIAAASDKPRRILSARLRRCFLLKLRAIV